MRCKHFLKSVVFAWNDLMISCLSTWESCNFMCILANFLLLLFINPAVCDLFSVHHQHLASSDHEEWLVLDDRKFCLVQDLFKVSYYCPLQLFQIVFKFLPSTKNGDLSIDHQQWIKVFIPSTCISIISCHPLFIQCDDDLMWRWIWMISVLKIKNIVLCGLSPLNPCCPVYWESWRFPKGWFAWTWWGSVQ